MPISHAHRCIFIHIPKAAGTSITSALRAGDPSLELDGTGLSDILMRHEGGDRLVQIYRHAFPVGSLAFAAQQHLPALILRSLLSNQTWNAYFKFAFIRNPWDMLVSFYHYRRALTPEQRSLNPGMDDVLQRCSDFSDVVRAYPMVRSDMTSLIADDEGRQLVDFVGRYENLAEDFAHVCRRIGLAPALAHENRSDHRAYREYYTGETRAAVERHFARDIERFGYSF